MTEAEEKYAVKIADKVMELSSYDTIKFNFVASVILEEFTDMPIEEIREWMYETTFYYATKKREAK